MGKKKIYERGREPNSKEELAIQCGKSGNFNLNV
jgi:hypothetical protein